MAQKRKGFFEMLIEDMAKTVDMKLAIDASRDESGRIDKWKATGMFMGRGNRSVGDIARFGAILGEEGAFDDDMDADNGSYPESAAPNRAWMTDDSPSVRDLIDDCDMVLFGEAGYDELDLELMDQDELIEAMEDAGIDTDFYDF